MTGYSEIQALGILQKINQADRKDAVVIVIHLSE